MTQQIDGINGNDTDRHPAWAGDLKLMARRVLDVLLPPHCLKCRVIVDEPGSLCAACWQEMTFLAAPACSVCGLPFEFAAGDGVLCAACIRRRPVYQRARAVLAYDDASRDLILGFKHADQTEAAPAFGRWLGRAGAELIAETDLLVPVPLHWTRFWKRRFNQSAELARALAHETRLPVLPDLLIRRRRTASQGGLGPLARARNVRGAFRLNPRYTARIPGKHLLLIDDVYTTGATVEACTRVLLRAGAASVDVVTLARVVRAAS